MHASRAIQERALSKPWNRVGRSLIDLLSTIQHLEAAGVDLGLFQASRAAEAGWTGAHALFEV